jgi:hypothetical protein
MEEETLKTDELLLLKQILPFMNEMSPLLEHQNKTEERSQKRRSAKFILTIVNYNFMRDKIVMIIHLILYIYIQSQHCRE